MEMTKIFNYIRYNGEWADVYVTKNGFFFEKFYGTGFVEKEKESVISAYWNKLNDQGYWKKMEAWYSLQINQNSSDFEKALQCLKIQKKDCWGDILTLIS